jgi:hypothetical protein
MIYDHPFTDDGSDPGNCSICHFFHTDDPYAAWNDDPYQDQDKP